jgi:hypothetical protein
MYTFTPRELTHVPPSPSHPPTFQSTIPPSYLPSLRTALALLREMQDSSSRRIHWRLNQQIPIRNRTSGALPIGRPTTEASAGGTARRSRYILPGVCFRSPSEQRAVQSPASASVGRPTPNQPRAGQRLHTSKPNSRLSRLVGGREVLGGAEDEARREVAKCSTA